MIGLHKSWTLLGLLLLTSCLDKKDDLSTGRTIPPRSLLAGKVEQRTTTFSSGSEAPSSRLVEHFGRQGELLQRDSFALAGSTETLLLQSTYSRDQDGYLLTINTSRQTATGQEQTQERFTYLNYAPGEKLLQSQTTYDSAGRKLVETTYSYQGLQPLQAVQTRYSYPPAGTATTQVLYTNYTYEGVFQIGRTYELVPSTSPGQPARPLYHYERTLRRDLYGRDLQQDLLYFDTSVTPEEQRLNRPIRLERSVWQYNSFGDEDLYSLAIYTQRPQRPDPPTPAPAEGQPEATPQALLEPSDRLLLEYRYSSPEANGFPTRCEITQSQGINSSKSTLYRSFSYRLFASSPTR